MAVERQRGSGALRLLLGLAHRRAGEEGERRAGRGEKGETMQDRRRKRRRRRAPCAASSPAAASRPGRLEASAAAASGLHREPFAASRSHVRFQPCASASAGGWCAEWLCAMPAPSRGKLLRKASSSSSYSMLAAITQQFYRLVMARTKMIYLKRSSLCSGPGAGLSAHTYHAAAVPEELCLDAWTVDSEVRLHKKPVPSLPQTRGTRDLLAANTKPCAPLSHQHAVAATGTDLTKTI